MSETGTAEYKACSLSSSFSPLLGFCFLLREKRLTKVMSYPGRVFGKVLLCCVGVQVVTRMSMQRFRPTLYYTNE